MQIILRPEQFDVVLTSNLFGDILSDEASALVGSIGMVPSLSAGDGPPLVEPIHGTAPQLVGKDVANPSATILCMSLLLRERFGVPEAAAMIERALDEVLAEGIRTVDIAAPGCTHGERVGDLPATCGRGSRSWRKKQNRKARNPTDIQIKAGRVSHCSGVYRLRDSCAAWRSSVSQEWDGGVTFRSFRSTFVACIPRSLCSCVGGPARRRAKRRQSEDEGVMRRHGGQGDEVPTREERAIRAPCRRLAEVCMAIGVPAVYASRWVSSTWARSGAWTLAVLWRLPEASSHRRVDLLRRVRGCAGACRAGPGAGPRPRSRS